RGHRGRLSQEKRAARVDLDSRAGRDECESENVGSRGVGRGRRFRRDRFVEMGRWICPERREGGHASSQCTGASPDRGAALRGIACAAESVARVCALGYFTTLNAGKRGSETRRCLSLSIAASLILVPVTVR